MRQSLLRRLRFTLGATFTVVLVLLAVAISLARVLLVYAPELRAELETALSELVQRPLTLGGLRAEWTGRHPTLILQDVRLTGGPAAGLAVGELEIGVDLLASLRDLRLRPATVAVSGLTLTVDYAADGSLTLSRIGDVELSRLSPEQGGMPPLPAEVHLRAATVELVDATDGRSYRFPQVDLWLSGDGEGYSLAGYLRLPRELGRSARFRAEWQGLTASGVDGRLYVDARELNLGTMMDLLRRLAPTPLLSGRAGGELWFDVAAGRLTEVAGRIDANDVRGRADAGSDWRSLAGHLGGRFDWRADSHGWQFDADDVDYASEYRVWPRNRLALRLTNEASATALEASAGYLRLDDLTPLLSVLPLPPPLRERLLALRPVGELLDPEGRLEWGLQELVGYRLNARFHGAGVEASGRIPGVQGLDGQLAMHTGGGSALLESHRGQLDFKGLFREPIPIRKLRAQLGWRIDADGWRLEAPLLRIENDDARAHARLRLFSTEGGAPVIDLRAHVSDANGGVTSRYLPAGILSKPLLGWLDQAIRAGRVPRAEVALFGRLDRFPYRDGSGVFDVQAEVAGAALAYQPGWPAIEGIDGQLRFFADRMDIVADSGRIEGARIEQARVSLANFDDANLAVAGRVQGEGASLLGFLRDSPLGRNLGEELAGLSLSGSHELGLRLDIPVHDHGRELKLAGTLDLNRGGFSAPAWNLDLTDLQGRVRFSERGVDASGVSGRYRGQPVSLSAETGLLGDQQRIRVTTRLRATPEDLMGIPALPGVGGGAVDWDVELLLPAFQAAAGAPPLLRLRSDLRGLEVDLPAPLAKPAVEPRRLKLELRAGADGLGRVAIDYGDARALLQLDSQRQPQRVGVVLGGGAPRLPAAPGIKLDGHVALLDLAAWRARWSTLSTSSAPAPAAAGADPLPLLGVDLRADRLRLLGQEFSQAALALRRQPNGWRLRLDGPDLAGRVLLPDAAAAVATVDLALLRLRSGGEAAAAAAGAPAEIPPLDLSVAELWLGAQSLGRLQLSLRPDAEGEGMHIQAASLRGPALEATAQGGWGGLPLQSRLQVEFSSINAGEAVELFGYSKALAGGLAEGSIGLAWPGGPAAFDAATLSGTIDLSLTNGRVLSVEPGAGRLFGLLSIAELPRRLSLNFTDLFGEGFAFDRIEAHLRVDRGNAFTRLFYMQGPAARVDLKGRIGWGSRDYDQEVTVTPHVSNALPVIGALAGGPVAAGVMFLTQKLLEKQLNKLTRFRYRVTGSWDDPRIEVLDHPAEQAAPAPAPSEAPPA